MARPTKKGLDYFSFDVDFFEDEKIEAICSEFGIKGEITAIKLLCTIYRNGYFIEWNDLYKMKLMKRLPGISLELLETIVCRLVKWNFFNEELFNSTQVLTSSGIQKRYLKAIGKRKDDSIGIYSVINEVSSGNNSINATINTQSKVKERKEENTGAPPDLSKSNLFRKPVIPDLPLVIQTFKQQGGSLEMAEAFFNKHSATEWFVNGSPIRSFTSLIPGFITNWKKFQQDETPVQPNGYKGITLVQ